MPRRLLFALAWLTLGATAFGQVPGPPEVIWEDGPLAAYYHLGYEVAWLGDVDGDQTDDYAASSPGNNTVRIYSGDSKTEIATLTGAVRHGHALTSLGDLDGDGVPDLAAGSPFVNANRGQVNVYSGATRTVLYSLTGQQSGDYFGWGLAGIGDTDGDGVPDLLIRTYQDQGRVRVHSGVDGSFRYEILPNGANELLGQGLAALPDLNHDGAADFLVGVPERNGIGEVVLHSGADGAPLSFFRDASTREFGAAVCALGDLDGDQVPDFAIGAPATSQGLATHAGEVRIYSGQTLAELHILRGAAQSDRFGALLAAGGDYNRDGVADLVVAAPGADANGLNSVGTVTLYSGADYAVLGQTSGTQQFERMPSSLAGPGDAHHDLNPDFLIGNFAYGSQENGLLRMWGAPSPWLQVDSLAIGRVATLSVGPCKLGSQVEFWASLRGQGPTPTGYGLALLSPPFRSLGTRTVLPTGQAELEGLVPPWLLGLSVNFQAIELPRSGPTRFSTVTQAVVH